MGWLWVRRLRHLQTGMSRSTRAGHLIAVLALVGLVAAACAGLDRPTATTSQVPTSQASATPPPQLTDEEWADARRFREAVGLRADDAWILAVAADPAADRSSFGIPLTPAEAADLLSRPLKAPNEVVRTVKA